MSVERICDQPKFKEELERIAAEQKRPLDDVLEEAKNCISELYADLCNGCKITLAWFKGSDAGSCATCPGCNDISHPSSFSELPCDAHLILKICLVSLRTTIPDCKCTTLLPFRQTTCAHTDDTGAERTLPSSSSFE